MLPLLDHEDVEKITDEADFREDYLDEKQGYA